MSGHRVILYLAGVSKEYTFPMRVFCWSVTFSSLANEVITATIQCKHSTRVLYCVQYGIFINFSEHLNLT